MDLSRISHAICIYVLVTIITVLPARGQNSILVLDGSNSMWGQIEGVAKIEIARDVITGLLTRIPETQALGLSLYGHRRKGDCTDIELAVRPATGNRAAIARAVAGVSPRGKTPLSDAVIAAAEALNFEEQEATVILVSDGIETCRRDPCAVARALEERGVNFTAHVIGFDVASPKDRAQLQCLAENTGGRFLTASTAPELTRALEEVAAPPPTTERLAMVFRAVDAGTGFPVRTGLVWKLEDISTGRVHIIEQPLADMRVAIPPGHYRATLKRLNDGVALIRDVYVVPSGPREVIIELPKTTRPRASLKAPSRAVAGQIVPVTWSGPGGGDDMVVVADRDAPPDLYHTYVYANEGQPVPLQMPARSGRYELRYLGEDGQGVMARAPVSVGPVSAQVSLPASAVAGQTIGVSWRGPDYPGDFIGLRADGETPGRLVRLAQTAEGNPVEVRSPDRPGRYQIAYVMAQDQTILATRPLSVAPARASLSADDVAYVRDDIPVSWTGPAYAGDRIALVDLVNARKITDLPVGPDTATPLPVALPADPGTYELRYLMGPRQMVLARHKLDLLPVSAALDAPAEAASAAEILVRWKGPNRDGDYISLSRSGFDEARKHSLRDTPDQTGQLALRLPDQPGRYELRYVMGQGGSILAVHPILLK